MKRRAGLFGRCCSCGGFWRCRRCNSYSSCRWCSGWRWRCWGFRRFRRLYIDVRIGWLLTDFTSNTLPKHAECIFRCRRKTKETALRIKHTGRGIRVRRYNAAYDSSRAARGVMWCDVVCRTYDPIIQSRVAAMRSRYVFVELAFRFGQFAIAGRFETFALEQVVLSVCGLRQFLRSSHVHWY